MLILKYLIFNQVSRWNVTSVIPKYPGMTASIVKRAKLRTATKLRFLLVLIWPVSTCLLQRSEKIINRNLSLLLIASLRYDDKVNSSILITI